MANLLATSAKCGCGSDAVYFRRHEGRYYCGNCFIGQFEKNIRRTVRKNHLISRDDRIAVALSGGKDSSALLYLMKKYENIFHIKVSAVSIDEGIARYRKKSLSSAKKLCKKLGVEHHVFSFKNEFGVRLDRMKTGGINYCTYCGVLRRYLLNRKSREFADKLAVGHNLDDEAQSIIMNFLRGDFSQFQRLGANPILLEDSKFTARIKPLRNIPEKETTLYAVLNSIPYHGGECTMPDSSMRWRVRDILNGLENQTPGTKQQIASFYDRLRPYLTKDVAKDMKYCRCGEPTSQEICRACQLVKGLE